MNLYRSFLPFLVRAVDPTLVWRALPPRAASPRGGRWCVSVDGKWLHRQRVALIYRDVTRRETLWWAFPLTESENALTDGMEELIAKLTVLPGAVVSDWKRGIRRAVYGTVGSVPHQRCLAHVIRQAYRLAPARSPFLATRRLRGHATVLLHVRNRAERDEWYRRMSAWGYQYGEMLTQKTIAPKVTGRRWWYTHGNLRRAWRLLTTDHRSFFVFLDIPELPRTTNSLEGVNRHIGSILEVHRGLTVGYQVSLISWLLAFSRVKTEGDLRRLWDMWRRGQ